MIRRRVIGNKMFIPLSRRPSISFNEVHSLDNSQDVCILWYRICVSERSSLRISPFYSRDHPSTSGSTQKIRQVRVVVLIMDIRFSTKGFPSSDNNLCVLEPRVGSVWVSLRDSHPRSLDTKLFERSPKNKGTLGIIRVDSKTRGSRT